MEDPTEDITGAIEVIDAPALQGSRVETLFQQFRDCLVDALGSGDPRTARARYERALELRAELAELDLPEEIQQQLDGFLGDLEARFPAAWRLNAAGAALERAGEAVTVVRQREDLEEAAAVLREGIEAGVAEADALRGALAQVDASLEEIEAADAPMTSLPVVAVTTAEPEELETLGVDAREALARETRVRVELDVEPEVHAAMMGARTAPLRGVTVFVEGDADPGKLYLEVSSEPPLVLPSRLELGALAPGEELELGARRLAGTVRHDHGVLRALTEVAPGSVRVAIVNDEGTTLAAETAPWRVHPSDSWSGLGTLPEMLAAFVLPNDDAVARILARAGELLEESTGESALDGYQSKDPRRALRIAEAIHRALSAEGFTYANPPASFESAGQRVRFPSKVLGTRLATCLDLALFECACLEQAGLHPLVVLTEGHAMAAAWLVERTFHTSVVDEHARFEKRVELTELVVVDSVTVTEEPSPGFDGARARAAERLEEPAEFHCAIDVVRARQGGVRPLWTETGDAPLPSSAAGESHDAGVESARDLDAEVEAYLAAEKRRRLLDETPATRLDRWLRQLLDLTMRNRLLNSSSTSKRVLPLLSGVDVGALEDRLADGGAFRVLARPAELEGIAQAEASDLEPLAGLFAAGVKGGKLYSPLGEAKLAERLVHLYREARTAREEGGASGLYLAIGFLEFLETPQATAPRQAPLLLVPLELKRATSGGKGYSFTLGADEPRVNVTLLELLRRDHDVDVAGLDPLPVDDSGIDVPLVLRIFKGAIKDKDGWRVDEALQVGLYSFAKHLLWRDLREREADLRRSPLVEHLLDRPHEAYPQGEPLTPPAGLDARYSAVEVFAPLSYDSSQLSAILGAAAGSTMVLEGPPGTGKSQTITNLIAHSIAMGKTVLFVSEKMAALDVVKRRLERLDLGPACLELHSNKANKKAVLAQFKEALDAGRVRGGKRRDWEEIAADVDGSNGRLNGHVEAMHDERVSGETVHGMICGGARAESGLAEASLDLGLADPRAVEAGTLAGWRRALDELDVQAAAAQVDAEHPLLLVGQSDTSPLFEAESRKVLLAFDEPAGRMAEAARSARAALGLVDLDVASEAGWSALGELGRAGAALPEAHGGALPWLADPGWLDRAGQLLGEVEELRGLRARFEAECTASPTTLDLERLERVASEWRGGGWFTRLRKGSELKKAARSIAKDAGSADVERALAWLDGARRAKGLEASTAAAADVGRAVFGAGWMGADGDPSGPSAFLAEARSVSSAWGLLTEEAGVRRGEHASALEAALVSAPASELEATAAELDGAREAFGAALAEVQRVARPLEGAPSGLRIEDFDAWRQLVRRWVDAWRGLRVWTRYQTARRDALDAGIRSVVAALEGGTLRAGQGRETFERTFQTQLVLHEISADERLKAFDGDDHGRAIERFGSLDEERLAAAAQEVRARLGQRRPTPKELEDTAGRSGTGLTGLALLQRELAKKTRHLAIRRLLASLGEVALELKPCFLMSPMSVAQYLDTDHPPFDLVVFDEASQIPVWDAIGALARGKQAVVVGDPKQLPPTSFFARGEDEALAEDEIEDLESILDECISAQVPTHRLTWHYRSRDESLIAFSNERYYDGELLTFPSNRGAGEARGVRVRRVEDGVYEKGSSRTNPVEAQAVVDFVMERLREAGQDALTVGVVTFNQAQQQLVLDLFEKALGAAPELEPHFAEGNDEGVFVKNLENVQGDERDLIVFSIGYGPDARGKVSMNFGPLNKDGGERRLNVAITRARQEVVVFTSLRSEDIDLARTSARGVRDLRAFLRFGETVGANAQEPPSSRSTSDGLVASVAEALRARGHQVDVEVGRGGVRVDLAVRDPERPGTYLLGVETDGAGYRSAATARDRDRLRGEVLGGLGWRIERLWAVDWWRDEAAEVARLEAALAEARDSLG